ncbi:putative pyridoxal kinase [Lecanora helva]
MAAFVMQSLGCDVAAVNTVQFSNHTGYKQWKGTKTSAEEIAELYAGLKQSYLTDFDMMLTGYAPSAESVKAIGAIARDLKLKASTKAGSFFWVLDPVMGDQGKLYVSEEVVPMYTNLLRDADLILPNQFEAEVLSEVKITSLSTLEEAIAKLHKSYRIPHIIVTSVQLPNAPSTMSIIGSTARSDFSARPFKIDVPAIDCYFSGTGDMFSALMVVRLREAVTTANLHTTKSWVPPDDIRATDLPLAQAAEKVLGSLHSVLTKTKEARDSELEGMSGPLGAMEKEKDSEKRLGLRRTKAAEVKVVRYLGDLRDPVLDWKSQALGEESERQEEQVLKD